ncbi:hypothetical protein HELRODRAFT_86199 [Helobdella robusta]|uniref:Serpin domain-containing protein n=1 Tax=Helobdella robusta TaxID=6412 RepID=T1G683_HELRO|nr:hypothetical protein HELRODRAFT_86199 [Helobdella robusta]ESN95907.1 hypothetical protein HELRODRAFT_86199 [Helobdella robusta]
MREDAVGPNRDFGISLYKELAAGNPQENIFFSPISLMFALGIALLGSRGETEKQLKSVMKIENMINADMHQGLFKLKSFLEDEKNPHELHIANRLFIEKSETLRGGFSKDCQKYYGSDPEKVEFMNDAPACVAKINRWVEKLTKGKIKNLISAADVSSSTKLILINAIVFKGTWMTKFYETESGEFSISPGSTVGIKFMIIQKLQAKYCDCKKLKSQILELPYKDKSMSFVIILPDVEQTNIENVEKKLDSGVLSEINEKLTETKLKIRLPKFSMTKESKVTEKLQTLGLTDLFIKGKADLYNMNLKLDLYVSKLVHKAFIEVNEEGTVAAAATGVQLGTRSSSIYLDFNANHPFIFYIKDNKLQTILFMGKFVKP